MRSRDQGVTQAGKMVQPLLLDPFSIEQAIADLLDLEFELNNIQQGLNQMERITPSDPFGDSFAPPSSAKLAPPPTKTIPSPKERHWLERDSQSAETPPPPTKPDKEQHWFDRETEALFDDGELPSSPLSAPPPQTSTTNSTQPTKNFGLNLARRSGKRCQVMTYCYNPDWSVRLTPLSDSTLLYTHQTAFKKMMIFLVNVINSDESWVFQYNPETKHQSSEQYMQGFSYPKKAWIANFVRQLLVKFGVATSQPPTPTYSPDLAPLGFFLFPRMRREFKGHRFDFIKVVQEATTKVLYSILETDFQRAFNEWQTYQTESIVPYPMPRYRQPDEAQKRWSLSTP
ncbi:positive regulation of aldosterone biosynthetic process [Homalodisca vitripennis]|nr:positive regulation of aldosterone biosynthetic process [Homalodisca vitripennis]